MTENNKPEQKFRVGGLTATIWKNVKEYKSEKQEYFTVSFEKSYKNGEEWKKTNSLMAQDVPKAILVLQKAFEFISLNKED